MFHKKIKLTVILFFTRQTREVCSDSATLIQIFQDEGETETDFGSCNIELSVNLLFDHHIQGFNQYLCVGPCTSPDRTAMSFETVTRLWQEFSKTPDTQDLVRLIR